MIQGGSDREGTRLAALQRYDVLDTPPEETFDRITRLASAALQTQIALVSMIDADRQWFKSRQGLDATETPRGTAFCHHAIMSDQMLLVQNALEDERFKENPLVVGDPHIRFYAGVPLKTPDGCNIGTLCVIDQQPRELSETEAAVLYDLARLVVDQLELRQIATTDVLTGLRTRRAFLSDVNQEIERARRYGRSASLIVFDLDHFKSINDTYGHAFGDAVLQRVAAICTSVLRNIDILGRLGGEEFCALLPETGQTSAVQTAERLRATLEATPIGNDAMEIDVAASFGVTELTDKDQVAQDVFIRADKALYQAKGDGRNRTVFA